VREVSREEEATLTEGAEVLELCQGEKRYLVEGLAGLYASISPRPPVRTGFRSKCWCLGAWFDLDRYDRLFVPDAARFRIHVLDANFNPILEFGGYDSVDSPGGNANAPGPEIPFECPIGVAVSDSAAYVFDAAPCVARIVRVRFSYAAEGSCPVP